MEDGSVLAMVREKSRVYLERHYEKKKARMKAQYQELRSNASNRERT